MHRLVCLGWISEPERKEKFSFETQVAPLRTQPKLQPRFLTLSPMRLSHNGYLELILRAERNAFHRGGRPQSKLLDIEVGGRNNVGEIDCHLDVAGWVRMSDDTVILVDELPKRRD